MVLCLCWHWYGTRQSARHCWLNSYDPIMKCYKNHSHLNIINFATTMFSLADKGNSKEQMSMILFHQSTSTYTMMQWYFLWGSAGTNSFISGKRIFVLEQTKPIGSGKNWKHVTKPFQTNNVGINGKHIITETIASLLKSKSLLMTQATFCHSITGKKHWTDFNPMTKSSWNFSIYLEYILIS